MAILDSKLLALQEIDKAAKQLEDILVSQFQKKLEVNGYPVTQPNYLTARVTRAH